MLVLNRKYFQSDTSSKRDEKQDSLSDGGEEEQDLTSFNQMFEADTSTFQHYSTPITRSPIPETPQQKRPTRAQQNNVSLKRSKPNDNASVQHVKIKSPPRSDVEIIQDDEETDYIEAPPSLKMDGIEQEEPKQFVESNGNGNIAETNTQDQGRFLLIYGRCFNFCMYFKMCDM